ncbi:hypothetical protein QBC43DRAFT_322710 [Cladorrhinum sp. PSN259]|nr:hypothetical protein QBC43DRAFT_322710 [Cladorrhinum sp. PSN259]
MSASLDSLTNLDAGSTSGGVSDTINLRLCRLKPSTSLGLFAYGSLTIDAVMHALLDRVPPSEQITAPGWRAAGLPDLPYPGLVPDQSSGAPGAPGRLYHDLTEREWALLDAFENPKYTLESVLLANGSTALAYVWPAEPPALAATWTPDSIGPDGMEEYLAMCVEWRQEWEASQVQ